MNSRVIVTKTAGFLVIAASLALATPAVGHYTSNDRRDPSTPFDAGFRGAWFNFGHLYSGSSPGSKVDDPLNLVFAGGTYEGNRNVHAGTVGLALEDNWNPKYESRMRKEAVCGDSLYTIWRHAAGRGERKPGSPGSTGIKQDLERSATHPNCDDQFHIRGYEDGPHWKHTASHGRRDQYLLAGIHHEQRKGTFGHRPDRDWDKVRIQAVKAMARHCSYRHYAYHPATDRPYKRYTNSGLLSRISLRRAADGCEGA